MTVVFFLFSVAMAKPKPGDPHSSHPSAISDKLPPSHPSKIQTSGINMLDNGKGPIKRPGLKPNCNAKFENCNIRPLKPTATHLPANKPVRKPNDNALPSSWLRNANRAPKVDPSHHVEPETEHFKGLVKPEGALPVPTLNVDV